MAGDRSRGQDVREIHPTELVQPIADQLPGPALERQDILDDDGVVYLKGSQEVVSAFLRHSRHSNLRFSAQLRVSYCWSGSGHANFI